MLNRQQFVWGLAGSLIAPSALGSAGGAAKHDNTFRKVSLSVGAEKPFTVLHISDTHLAILTDAEKAESAWRKKYYERRYAGSFRKAEEHLAAAIAYASEKGFPIIHTGDLVDCPSDGNIEIVKRLLPRGSVLASVGNHETCSRYFRGNSEKPGDIARERNESVVRIEKCWPNDRRVFSRVVNGVNFVLFDNSDYQIAADVRPGLEREFARALPVVLGCHIPFYTPELMASPIRRGKSPAMFGVTPEISDAKERAFPFPDEQRPTKETLDAVAWLKDRPNLKAVLAGHLHAYWQGELKPDMLQLVAGAHFKGCGYEISFT